MLSERRPLRTAREPASLATALAHLGHTSFPLDASLAANAVAGLLEKLGRDEEAVAAMGRAAELAVEAADGDANEPIARSAARNLAALQAHVRRKQERKSKSELR